SLAVFAVDLMAKTVEGKMNEVAIGTHDSVMEERPFAMPSSKLVMWLFIISDAVTFGALLYAYGYLRNATPNWPTPFQPASIVNVMIMTFILITSSLTILLGVRSALRDDKRAAIRWTLITAAGGVLFALLHVREWLGLIHEGVRLYQNPWGPGL